MNKRMTDQVYEILDLIQNYGKNCPAILIFKKGDRRTLVDFMPKEDWKEWCDDYPPNPNEDTEEMTLFLVLCEFLMAKKYDETKRLQSVYTTLLPAARMCKGYSQAEMAFALGIPKRTLEDWEGGQRIPSKLDKVLSWLRICDVPISDFMEFEKKIKIFPKSY